MKREVLWKLTLGVYCCCWLNELIGKPAVYVYVFWWIYLDFNRVKTENTDSRQLFWRWVMAGFLLGAHYIPGAVVFYHEQSHGEIMWVSFPRRRKWSWDFPGRGSWESGTQEVALESRCILVAWWWKERVILCILKIKCKIWSKYLLVLWWSGLVKGGLRLKVL